MSATHQTQGGQEPDTVTISGESQAAGATLIQSSNAHLRCFYFNKLGTLVLSIYLVAIAAGCDSPAAGRDGNPAASAATNPLASALVTPVHVRVKSVAPADIRRQATAAGVVESVPDCHRRRGDQWAGDFTLVVEPGDAVSAGQALITLDRETGADSARSGARRDSLPGDRPGAGAERTAARPRSACPGIHQRRHAGEPGLRGRRGRDRHLRQPARNLPPPSVCWPTRRCGRLSRALPNRFTFTKATT